ncbi:SDR family oxidoreductase [Gracilibacillus alcaliphilus]|uniref:SDR family oxidoreductase n=1 Tax=Gracilibacillus alcaliphilus TaxID=1401441 RepID=UPI00195902AA|nr:SDR family oxidoreductase [Gracilibacillus alcaliphilus]MBM7676234.1 NAD(P)-dependent dehydrogenase (short-subunit alcohol dehydrogenase family) [Gracilibacillus alcaliphilus]
MNILLFDANHCIAEALTQSFQSVYMLEFTDRLKGQGKLCQYKSGQRQESLLTFDLLEDEAASIAAWLDQHDVRLEAMVNNLEQVTDKSLLETSLVQWQESLLINLHFPFLLVKALVPYLSERGQCIHLSSTMAVSGESGAVNYASHKSALESFSKSLSRECSERQIRSNVISVSPRCWKETNGVQQVSQMIYQMCYNPASFLNGQVITFDNGETLS